MNRQNFINREHRSYPLSTGVLDFLQKQIELIYGAAAMAGRNYILSRPTPENDGLIVIDGELMPLKHSAAIQTYIEIVEECTTIVAQNIHYVDAQVMRYAKYRSDSVGAAIEVAQLEDFTSLNDTSKALSATQAELAQTIGRVKSTEDSMQEIQPILNALQPTIAETNNHTLPKGAIIMWSGAATQLPNGYALCNGQTSNGVKTPDLRGRFIVGAGGSYDVDKTGGSETAALEPHHLPSHSHGLTMKFLGYRHGSGGDKYTPIGEIDPNIQNDRSGKTNAAGSGLRHENMPPYYALAFIMKVI